MYIFSLTNLKLAGGSESPYESKAFKNIFEKRKVWESGVKLTKHSFKNTHQISLY